MANYGARKISEVTNRLEGTYSLDMEYVLRKDATATSILKYNVDIGYDDERGFYTASIKGNLVAPLPNDIDDIRTDFNSINIYGLVLSVFTNVTSYTYLNPEPDSYSIDENENDNILNFSYSYTSNPQDIKFDYSVDLSNEYTNDLATVAFNGTLNARGHQSTRQAKLENALASLDVLSLCQDFYINASNSSATLNNIYKNYSVTRNVANPSISITATFDNTPQPPLGFKAFNWSISIMPSFYQYKPVQFIDGTNAAFNLNYFKRGKISIQGNAVFDNSNDNSALIRNEAINILNQYSNNFTNRVRVEDKIDRNLTSQDNNGYNYTFSISDTCETPIFSLT